MTKLKILEFWAKTKGSRKLQLLIKHNYNWIDEAIAEYFKAFCPDGFEVMDAVDKYKMETPSLKDLEFLDTFVLPILNSPLIEVEQFFISAFSTLQGFKRGVAVEVSLCVDDKHKINYRHYFKQRENLEGNNNGNL